jgi:hypothetical protein
MMFMLIESASSYERLHAGPAPAIPSHNFGAGLSGDGIGSDPNQDSLFWTLEQKTEEMND